MADNGKRKWTTATTFRSEFFCVSTHLYHYINGNPDSEFYKDSNIWCALYFHLDVADIHHVLHKTQSINVTEPTANAVWVPGTYRDMLLTMNSDGYEKKVGTKLASEHFQEGKKKKLSFPVFF